MRKLILGFILLSFHYLALAQALDPGTIGSDQQVCYGSAPKALTQTPASGGTPNYRYQWQRSNDNGITWINIYRAAKVTYSLPLLAKTALFRRRVTDAANTVLYTNTVTIAVTATLIAGAIGNPQTICHGSLPNGLVQLTPATGGGGIYTYRWQISTDGLYWSDIQGAVSAGYSPSALTVDTWYRRWVIDASCGSTASNSVKITVNPQITLAQLHDNITIDENTSTNFNIVISGGVSPFTVNYTQNGITQTTINNYISGTNISTGVLPAGIYNYALTSVTDANGCVAQSMGSNISVTAAVNGNLTACSIGSAQNICYNTVPAPLTQITAPTGGTGEYSYQWQSSPDNVAWTDITGATLPAYSPPALTSSIYYRCTITSGNYLPVYSNFVLTTVSPQIALAQLHDNITIYNNSSTYFNISITGGTSPFTINYTLNGVAQPAINNYISGSNITTGVLTSGTYSYVLTSVTDANGCEAQNLGTSIAVTVMADTPSASTLFTTEVPLAFVTGTRYDLGTEFRVLSSGYITKARLFSYFDEGGDHIVRLWIYNGSSYMLVAGPFTWNFLPGYQGWREYELSSPIWVTANTNYIISITNSTDNWFPATGNFSPSTVNENISYIRGLYTTNLGSVPSLEYNARCYFRDIVIVVGGNENLTPGSVGNSQSICYNTTPAALIQLTAPTGGTGEYTYQWQSSPDNVAWTDITGATFPSYSPPALTSSTYYRRAITSGNYLPVYSNFVLITVSSQMTLAQLHDNITIYNNSTTFFNVSITGGISPFTFNYTLNGVAQPAISNYVSGTNISTGMLSTGVYTYSLTSVTDANGCEPQSLGTSITVTVMADTPVTATLFTTEVPAAWGAGTRYELGTEFQVLSAGYITKARLFSYFEEGGDHIVRLWMYNGSAYTLVAGPYTWNFISGYQGWREYELPSAVWVTANTRYIISITNSVDNWFAKTENFSPATINENISYIRGLYTTNLGSVPSLEFNASCYFRDIVIAVGGNANLTPGSIGNSQPICYNTIPAPLTQTTAPTGGTGEYSFQWQSSPDNLTWTDITGATLPIYSPPALTSSTYYRRTITSGSYLPVYSNFVLITVSPQMTLAQLHDNITIYNNSTTFFNVSITGGISPFTINYTLNGVIQPALSNYINGTNITTGVLTAGTYSYVLTSVTDANGCAAQNLGASITVTVTNDTSPTSTLLTTEVPGAWSTGARYDLGTEFQVLSTGIITKARLFSHIEEGGDHIVRLWMYNGSSYTLVAGPYTWNFTSGYQGWREYELPSAVWVTANTRYIISITNSIDTWFAKTENFSPAVVNGNISYIRGLYTTIIGSVPALTYLSSCYFRDIVFEKNGNLAAGTIGNSQTMCYNTTPATLIQLTAPTGGTGEYTYQWQSSPDNVAWTDITGATLPIYSPPALTASTYYRRTITSGSYLPVYSNYILITVSPQITLAQLHDNITIYNNTSTLINISVTGGTSPFTINYTLNGIAQPTIHNYINGTNISTGVLNSGEYTYSLTSVTDAVGCLAQNIGVSIIITVTDDQNTQINSNKALVIVNSSSTYYSQFIDYIIPYLDNFGIPYDVCDVSSASLPTLSDFSLLIFGHRDVYSSDYPIAQLESAVSGGVGLCSFDPHLFDYTSAFNEIITEQSVRSNYITISNYTHYITRFHAPDTYNTLNNRIDLLGPMTIVQNSNLVNNIDLASLSSGEQTVNLLQVANYGNGKIVKWNGTDWLLDDWLGPVYGMDDLLWRSIVWSARKPFVMQGLPPMITMRVDDAEGNGNELSNQFRWIRICNEYGIIPWCGTFINAMSLESITALKTLTDNNLATSSPHAFTTTDFIYFNHNNLGSFDPAANTRQARQFYLQYGLRISKYVLPHWYEISSTAFPEVHNMGGEFIGIIMPPDNFYSETPWINNAPYRINRNGFANSVNPVYYADNNTINGINFFNCLTEIRDDGGYEWYPDNDVLATSARGIRHLRRALNSMVLPVLFTHESSIDLISISNFRGILSNITSAISEYKPEYTSMDYALQYIRAKKNIRITNVVENLLNVEIYYSGNNDISTKCYLFTGEDNQITYQFINLPQTDGSSTVSVLK